VRMIYAAPSITGEPIFVNFVEVTYRPPRYDMDFSGSFYAWNDLLRHLSIACGTEQRMPKEE